MCVGGSRAHVEVLAQVAKKAKMGKNFNIKFKVFPSSEQKADNTSPPKCDLCDFETSLRIQIRHDSDYE